MGKISEIARITVKGVDHADDGTTRGQAYVLYLAVLSRLTDPGAPAPVTLRRDDVDGFRWEGSVSSIIRDLWPVLGSERNALGRNEFGIKITEYLRLTNNLVCTHRGGLARASTWWIRADWNDAEPNRGPTSFQLTYAEKKLTEHEAGEDRRPQPVALSFQEPKPTPPQRRLPGTHGQPVEDVDVTDTPLAPEPAPPSALASPSPSPSPSTPKPVATSAVVRVTTASATERGAYRCPRCGTTHKRPQDLANHAQGHQTRDRVLEAGVVLRRQNPDRAVSLYDVAEAARVHYTTVRGHFGTASELTEAIDAYAATGDDPVTRAAAIAGTENGAPNADGRFPCRRGCDRTFETPSGRGVHESAHATKNRILDATVQILLERPDEDPLISEIAERLDLHPTAIYSHFARKGDLVAEARRRLAAAPVARAVRPKPKATESVATTMVKPEPEPEPELKVEVVAEELTGRTTRDRAAFIIQLLVAFAAKHDAYLNRTVIRYLRTGLSVNTDANYGVLDELVRAGKLQTLTVQQWQHHQVYAAGPNLDPEVRAIVEGTGGSQAPFDPVAAVRGLVQEVESLRASAGATESALRSAKENEDRARRLQERLDGLRGLLSGE